jgi:hypothetical protein
LRFSFRATSFSIESSSSGVAVGATEGEIVAVALVEVMAVAVGEGGGVGVWPNTVKASAIEQREVKSVVFIGVLLQ